MSDHLKSVRFTDDSASGLECVVGLARCIAAGHLDQEFGDDPALAPRVLGRVGEAGVEFWVGKKVDPNAPVVIGDAEVQPLAAWEELAAAVGVTPQVAADASPADRSKAFPWQLVIQLAWEVIQQWLDSRS